MCNFTFDAYFFSLLLCLLVFLLRFYITVNYVSLLKRNFTCRSLYKIYQLIFTFPLLHALLLLRIFTAFIFLRFVPLILHLLHILFLMLNFTLKSELFNLFSTQSAEIIYLRIRKKNMDIVYSNIQS